MKQSREGKKRKRGRAGRTRQRSRRARLVGPASKLLEVERHVARLRCRPDQRLASKALYGFGLLCGVGLAVGALFEDSVLWWGQLVTLPVLGLAYMLGTTDFETRFDFERGLVQRGAHGAIPFSKLVGISAVAETSVVGRRERKHEVRRFELALILADADQLLGEAFASMRRDRIAMIREGGAPVSHELSPRLVHELNAQLLRIVDTVDETAVWQVAEWLAKNLDLPLVDACTSPAVLRVPEELDLPLGERLALGLQAIDVPAAYASAAAPEGASVRRQRGACLLSWRRNRRSDILLTLGLVLLFPAMGGLLQQDGNPIFWICAALGLCLLPLVVLAAQWHGVNQLALDKQRVAVTRGPFGKRLPPLAMDAVEAVRVGGTNEHPLLTLVTDARVLRVPMTVELARWSKQHIERHLLATYRKKLKAAP